MPEALLAGTASTEWKSVRAILDAASFAAARHAAQKRKGAAAEPYVNHLLEVAQLVSEALAEPDTNLIIAALLHDAIEDVGVTGEELTQRFNADVAALVAEVTDDKSLSKAERKRLQIVTAPKKSPRAQVIKLADKISNLRAILHSPPVNWTMERRREYFEWARQVVDGLSAPNALLKQEFESTYRKFQEGLETPR
jgi:GTP diphosphokinase / guanosine-3',5'-bis(diphosphate) 3'-diphosphatase